MSQTKRVGLSESTAGVESPRRNHGHGEPGERAGSHVVLLTRLDFRPVLIISAAD
jgi:hypothetical protein